MPKYQHDCTECNFLGQTKTENCIYDLYYCNPTKKQNTGTFIGRFGNEKELKNHCKHLIKEVITNEKV